MRKFIKIITESETITEISQDLKDRYVSKSLDSIPTSSPKNMSKRINGVNKAYGSDAAVPENNVVQETMKFLLDALQSKYTHIGTNDALVGDYEIFKINDGLNLWISPRDSLHNRGGKKFLWMRLLATDNKAVFTQKFAFSSVKAPQEMLNKLTFVLNAALKKLSNTENKQRVDEFLGMGTKPSSDMFIKSVFDNLKISFPRQGYKLSIDSPLFVAFKQDASDRSFRVGKDFDYVVRFSPSNDKKFLQIEHMAFMDNSKESKTFAKEKIAFAALEKSNAIVPTIAEAVMRLIRKTKGSEYSNLKSV